MTVLPWAGFVQLDADAGIFANIGEKVSLMRTGVQVEQISGFVNVRKRHDVRPSRSVAGADVSETLLTQEVTRIFIGHLAIGTNHATAMLSCRRKL
jgi:hypothetical protein